MLGIYLNIPNGYGCYIDQIFKSIDVSKYKWDIITDDIFGGGDIEGRHGLFFQNQESQEMPDFIDGETFKETISVNNYYILFADFKAYPPESRRSKIKSLDDFMNSDCEIVFLCADCSSVVCFCKNINVLVQIHSNCEYFNFENIEPITVDEATVYGFCAF